MLFVDESGSLISEGDADGASGFDDLTVLVHQAELIDGFLNGNIAHLIVLIADHPSKAALLDKINGFGTKANAKDAVEGGGRSSALEMAEGA